VARYLNGFCFSQRIFPPQIIQVLLRNIPFREYTQKNPTTDYPHVLAKTWEASFYHAQQDCPAARELLQILAFIPDDTIPYKLFEAAPEVLPESLRDTFDRHTAIEALARFSLLRADVDTLNVHRLVQLVTRDMLDETTTKTFFKIARRLQVAQFTPVYSMDSIDLVSDIVSATLFTPEEEALLAEIKEPVQRATFTLQKIMERENLKASILTNMSHMLYDTAKSIAQNVR